MGFSIEKYLGSGEIGLITKDGYEQLKKPGDLMQICAFLWIYYGFPASNSEGINVETTRYRCGAMLAERDKKDILEKTLRIDFVAGIPDSGTAHALGYAEAMGLPFKRPFVKYSPAWQRSFMPEDQEDRDLTANMKLILNEELARGFKIMFNEDSIVRATQLIKKIKELNNVGAEEVHMRPACPPLTQICPYLNFSRSRSVFDLAARRAVREIEGRENFDIAPYLDEKSDKYLKMVDVIRARLELKSLRYPSKEGMVSVIGLPREKLCLECWGA